MSVVIAAKYKDGVAMVADKQSTCGTTKTNSATKMQYFKYSNSAIGIVGYLRDCNVMRTLEEVMPYKDILDGVQVDELYVIKSIIPAIFNHMSANKRLTNTNEVHEMDSLMLYATPDGIYKIGGDFSVIESDTSYGTIGCGDDKVVGYMSSIGNTSKYDEEAIQEVLEGAIIQACEKDAFINDMYDIVFLRRA